MTMLRVGLIGTGYAAKLRAQAIAADPRSQLAIVAGHTPEKTGEFCRVYAAEIAESWLAVVERSDLDLVIVANANYEHGAIVRAALQSGKHVVVEYPLSLDVEDAQELILLARQRQRMLHVEHIDQLSGIHQAIVEALPDVGTPFYVRYSSLNAQRPAPQKWTYRLDLFGFPLMGALSRVHRLTSLFGRVANVSGRSRYWIGTTELATLPTRSLPYTSCICTAQLQFANGVVADLSYGKGEALWQRERVLEIHASDGMIRLVDAEGVLVSPQGTRPLDVGTRRGLFARDTAIVLDHLTQATPLYVQPEDSLYALRVADAIRRSSTTGEVINL